MIGLLAILKSGAAYVPVDPSYPKDRIEYMLEDSKATLLLTQEELKDNLTNINSEIICIDTLDVSSNSSENLNVTMSSKNLAYVIYTSGSTGFPKGVMVEHIGVTRLVKEQNYANLNNETVMLQSATVSFDAATFEIYGAILNGGSLVLYPNKIIDLKEINRVIKDNNITTMWLTAGLFEKWVYSLEDNLTSLKYVLAGGDVLNPTAVKSLYEKYPNINIINGYGPTESTTFTTTHLISKITDSNSIPIGKPINNTQLYILDKNNNLVPKGVSGELHISGDGLARGYLNKEELTKEKFIKNVFDKDSNSKMYKTGDLVKYLEDGNIEYLGRIDDQVKIRGFRIELGEIEQQLLLIANIKESVVLAKEDDNGNKVLVAYVVTTNNEEINIMDIKTTLLQTLPEYMIPTAIVTIETMPLTPNGKTNKKALLKLDVEIKSSQEYVAPRDEIEEKLATIFSDILNVEKVGIYDNFFELGGHSLLATQVVSQVRTQLSVELPLKVLFESANIYALQDYIKNSAKTSTLSNIEIIENREVLPLSFTQDRLWFLNQFEGESSTYNIPGLLLLEGTLNKEALNKALFTILQRHESLRTNFFVQDDISIVKVKELDEFKVDEISLENSSIEETVITTLNKPFNLSSDLLFRATILTKSSKENYLFINMHHIISDGWSIGLFINEFTTLYNAYNNNQDNPLPPLAIQYGDYAAWQKDYLSGEVLENKLSYWKEQLDAVEPLELQTTYQRPAIQSYIGNTIEFTLDETLSKKLNQISKTNDVTLFMTLISSFSLLMNRYTQQDDITIGTPIANRNRSEVEQLIGFFVNTLVLRQDFSNNLNFTQLLEQVKKTTLDAYEHQDVPFEKVVDALNISRDTSRSPLFQIMFVLQNNQEATLDLPNLTITPQNLENNTAKFDLTMNVTEANDKLYGSIEYATDLFSSEYINSLITHFKQLLNSIVEDITIDVNKYELLTQKEQTQLTVEYNQTQTTY
ncbi:MAG: amino acid adenylation domain-containing protein, partial [Arcobacter sp.]|nr:amino acid adenylation domain-containing protein [Arcobacter sp.]